MVNVPKSASLLLIYIINILNLIFYAQAPSFQRVAQIPPQAIVPVVMAPPAYVNQVGATTAPAMLVPTQNTQKEANTAGVGLMYVQVPTNEVLSGNTYAAVPTQVPQMNTYLVGAATSEGIQVRYNLIFI